MALKALFIINPQAGRGSALRTWRRLEGLVARDPQVDAVIPSSCAETRRVAAEAVKAGVQRVVVVGGDGTLDAVVGELVQSDTSIGFIPAGTGNDFHRNVGLPRRPEAALAVAMGGQVARVDVGRALDGHYFLNAAGVGFDAEVAAAAGRYPAGLGGTLPYLLGALSTLVRYQPISATITVDEQQYVGPITMVAIANGRYYGGGMQIAPGAHHADGLFDVIIAGELGRSELLYLLRQVYAGRHTGHPKVRTLRGREVHVAVAEGVRAHVDGDPFPWTRLGFQVEQGALQVARPG